TDRSRLTVDAPVLWGIRMTGEQAVAILDFDTCRTAHDSSWQMTTPVEALRVAVSRPAAGLKLPSRKDSAFEMLTTPGLATDPFELPLVVTRGELPLDLGLDQRLDVTSNDTVSTSYPWLVRVQPVFADRSRGAWSPPVQVPVGVARTHAMLRRGLMARMPAAQ